MSDRVQCVLVHQEPMHKFSAYSSMAQAFHFFHLLSTVLGRPLYFKLVMLHDYAPSLSSFFIRLS